MAYTSKPSVTALGVGSVYVADFDAANQISPTGGWTEMFKTLKDSFSFTQEDGETTDIKANTGETLYSFTTDGKLGFKFIIPNTSKSMLQMFFNTVVVAEAAPTGFEAVGMKTSNKSIEKMIKIDFADKNQSFIFPYISVSRKYSGDNPNEAPIGIEVSATITSNPDPTKGDYFVVTKMDGAA